MPKNILIVEDEEIIRKLLRRSLAALGHTLVFAEDLARAREQIGKMPYDLLITDLKFPDGTGMEVIREFQARCPGAKIIAMTGSLSPEDHFTPERALAGMELILKPFDLEVFGKKVQELLG